MDCPPPWFGVLDALVGSKFPLWKADETKDKVFFCEAFLSGTCVLELELVLDGEVGGCIWVLFSGLNGEMIEDMSANAWRAPV